MPAANCLGLVYSMYELYIVEAYGPKALVCAGCDFALGVRSSHPHACHTQRNKNMSHIHDFTNFVQYYILQRFGCVMTLLVPRLHS